MVNARNYLYLTEFSESVFRGQIAFSHAKSGRKILPRAAIKHDDFNHLPSIKMGRAHLAGLCFSINLADDPAAN
jgi:hypothetical protein